MATEEEWSLINKDALEIMGSIGCLLVNKEGQFYPAPISLIPAPIPSHHYQHIVQLQPLFNLLYHLIANDKPFLHQCFKDMIKEDEYMRRIWEIYDVTTDEHGHKDKVDIGLNRGDYFLHVASPSDEGTMKQVEFNTVATGGSFASIMFNDVHRALARKYPILDVDHEKVVRGRGGDVFCEAIVEGWKSYGEQNAVVLMVVDFEDKLFTDMKRVELGLYRHNPRIMVRKREFKQLRTQLTLEEDRRLFLEEEEVALVYYRWGYAPHHYTSEEDWRVRLLVEKSKAIVNPSAGYQLAGSKKVQQVLTQDGMLERFVGQISHQLRGVFAGIYSLDLDEEGDKNSKMAQLDPDKYVLKPQREGGGNNIFGEDLRRELERLDGKEGRSKYILMDRLTPRPFTSYPLVCEGDKVVPLQAVFEVGIYGAIVGKNKEVWYNKADGSLTRSKSQYVNEGGFTAGLGFADSVCLVD